jgi:Aldehyde dehydrogenase family
VNSLLYIYILFSSFYFKLQYNLVLYFIAALIIDPLIGAVAAGNAVVLKPSEGAPSISSFFSKFLPKYIDSSCVKVVEGAVPETTALLEQKWDKIFYTGHYFSLLSCPLKCTLFNLYFAYEF